MCPAKPFTSLFVHGGVHHAMVGLSSGGINRVVYEMLVRYFSTDYAVEIGCSSTVPDGKDTAEDADVVNSQYELLLAGLSELLMTELSFKEPPKVFVLLLLDPADPLHRDTLAYLRRLYTAILALESQAARTKDKVLSKWIRDLVWTESAWTREVLETLRVDNWELRREYLHKSLMDYAQSWRSTLICENGNRVGRSREVAASGKSSILRLWHHLQSTSGLAAEYGRECVQAEGNQSKQQLTDDFFRPDHSQSSLAPSTVDKLIEPAPAFPTHSPAEYKLASLHSLCVHHHEGSWTKLQDSWWSRLLSPGSVVSSDDVGQQRVHLVVRSSAYGALVIDGQLDKVQQKVAAFSFTVNNPVVTSVFVVRDPRKTKVVTTKLCTPGSVEHMSLKEPMTSILLVPAMKKGMTLLEWSAQNGFKPLTVPLLRELLRRLQLLDAGSSGSVASEKCLGEEDLIRRLAKIVYKTDIDQHTTDMLAARCKSVSDTLLEKTPVEVGGDMANDTSNSDSDCLEHPDVDELTESIAAAKSRQSRYRALTDAITKKRKKDTSTVPAKLHASGVAVDIPFGGAKPLTLTEAR
eukprot:6476992-Amphidinium_carterae.2